MSVSFSFERRCNITEYSDMKQEKENKNAEISARIMKVVEYLGETANSFALKLGYQRAQTIYDIRDMKSAPSYDFFKRFSNAGYSAIINLDWLLTGEGSMLREPMKRDASGDEAGRERKLIPFYDDVITVGGRNTLSAAMDGRMPNGDMIDAGDWFTDATAAQVVDARGLRQISDTSALEAMAREVLAGNAKAVEQYKGGKTNVLGFLVGQCMRASKGQGNPAVLKEMLTRLLEEM